MFSYSSVHSEVHNKVKSPPFFSICIITHVLVILFSATLDDISCFGFKYSLFTLHTGSVMISTPVLDVRHVSFSCFWLPSCLVVRIRRDVGVKPNFLCKGAKESSTTAANSHLSFAIVSHEIMTGNKEK